MFQDLFNFKKNALCLTHDLLECDCGGNGLVLNNDKNYECNNEKSETPLRVNELMKWEHHSTPFNNNVLEVCIIVTIFTIVFWIALILIFYHSFSNL